MLRLPSLVPTVPLTQAGTQLQLKLYHEHYQTQAQTPCNQCKQQQQPQQQHRKFKLLSRATTTTTSASSRTKAAKTNDHNIPKTTFTDLNSNTSTTPSLNNVYRYNQNIDFTKTSPLLSSSAAVPALPTSAASLSMSPTTQTPSRTSLFDSCHRKIRLIGGGPVAFLGGLVAKARRKERDGDQNSSDTKLYLEESVLERKLPEADLKALVDLPAGLDYNEWLASHTLALFEHVNLVYGTVSEFCTPSGCPDMTGPGNRTYLWFDEKGKKTRVAAPQYIDYVMTFTQKTVSDESIFPTKYANEFPSSFESISRKILRLQFHVIAHLYAAHFREIALLGLHTHLNLTFAHLTALHRRFNLIDEKETDVLRDLEVALRLTDDNNSSSSGSSNHQGSSSNIDSNYQTWTSYSSTYPAGNSGSNSHHQHSVGHANNMATASTADDSNPLHAAAIDGDACSEPICTQPEAKVGAGGAGSVFGGGGGLMGGILGDFTSSEFSDTSRYCTSAVPSSSANSNNGAGALQLNFNNNYHTHPHQHHLQHHQHQQQQQHQHQQNMGLMQCNNTSASPHNTTTA